MENYLSYIIGIMGIVTMMITWVAVQGLWKKVFAENITDEDVLADRRSCGNCGCMGGTCRNEKEKIN